MEGKGIGLLGKKGERRRIRVSGQEVNYEEGKG